MLEDIIEQTKLYSEQYKSSNNVTTKSRVSRWLKQEPIVPELLRFIAVILVMGFIKYLSIESHWSKSWPYVCDTFSKVSSCKRVIIIIIELHTYYNVFLQVMKRDRFTMMLKFLHINDNSK